MIFFKSLGVDGRAYFLLAFFSMALGVLAQSLIKKYALYLEDIYSIALSVQLMDFKLVYLVLGLLFYVMATLFWVLSLKKVSLQFSSCVLSLSYVLNVLVSLFVFSEFYSPLFILGIALIFSGVFLVGLSCGK